MFLKSHMDIRTSSSLMRRPNCTTSLQDDSNFLHIPRQKRLSTRLEFSVGTEYNTIMQDLIRDKHIEKIDCTLFKRLDSFIFTSGDHSVDSN